MDSEEIRKRIKGKLDSGENLDDKDLMQLIIYPPDIFWQEEAGGSRKRGHRAYRENR